MITDEQGRAVKLLLRRHPNHRLAKYANWRAECKVAEHYTHLLGLHESTPLKILDMGGGLSYFAAECQGMGHDATTMDLPDPLPEAMAKALGVKYIPHVITAGTPLPGDETYNLITAIRLNLTEPTRWGWVEYREFADEVLRRLNPGGRWFMAPNRGENVDFVLHAEKWKAILGARATASSPSRTSVLITKR